MKKGFTLAEVLVTLAVIGVVAALAIPALLQNTNDAQYKTAWKKALSEIDQATKSIMADNGGSLKKVFSSSDQIMGLYLEKMSAVKTCLDADGTDPCWPSDADLKALDGNPANIGTAHSAAILNNGSSISFQYLSNNCTGGSTWDDTPNGKGVCALIRVDVNGLKKPNVIGKDVFAVWIQDDRLAPLGTQVDPYPSGTHCTPTPGTGWGCSALYLYGE